MNALGDDLVHAITAFLLARQGPWGTTWEVAHEAASLRTVDRRFYGLLQQFYIKMGFASHAELVQAVTKDKDTRITKSRAKEEYHLTDKELNSIPCLLCRNPVFRSAAAMKLYQLVTVVVPPNTSGDPDPTWNRPLLCYKKGGRSDKTTRRPEKISVAQNSSTPYNDGVSSCDTTRGCATISSRKTKGNSTRSSTPWTR